MSIGKKFRISVFGSSHGPHVGVLISGVPKGTPILEGEINEELERRKPGASKLTSQRKESDRVQILSGVSKGRSTGARIKAIVPNRDVDSSAYEKIRYTPRPSHADYPAYVKYKGKHDYRGGGVFSARLTVGYVIAGAIAKRILSRKKVKIASRIVQIGPSKNPREFEEIVSEAKSHNDSVSGVIECTAENVLPGIGEPLDCPLDADLASALFHIPAVKAVEFGSTKNYGSENNDEYVTRGGKIITKTNNAGGILGGLTTGMPIVFRVLFKPTSSIGKVQNTVDLRTLKPAKIQVGGRHDPCVALRAPVIVEAVSACVLLDHYMRSKAL